MTGEKALNLVLYRKPSTVLDVGAGKGNHTRRFLDAGCSVTGIDLNPRPFRHEKLIWWKTDFTDTGGFLWDLVWCSHCLEHLPDVGKALSRMRDCLTPEGYLAVTVPPRKDALVGGHVSLWTPGLLVYRLILAGFDCSRAAVSMYGYNISAIVSNSQVVPGHVLANLAHDKGDIEALARYFPWPVSQGIDGFELPTVNWR